MSYALPRSFGINRLMIGPGSTHALATYSVFVFASCSPALATADCTTWLISTAERCLLNRSRVIASSTSRPLIRFITRRAFRGEMRATGQVLRDQLLFLHRAGFDAFEVTKDSDAAAFAEAVHRYSVFYQPTGDGRASTLTARRARDESPVVRGRREYAA